MNQTRKVSGSVLKLRCTACNSVFPHFRFSGEDDAETIGLYSITSCGKNDVIVAETEPTEWNTFEHGGSNEFERRLRKQLDRDDLRLVRFLRAESQSASGAGASFRDFMKIYIPPEEIFSCPCCAIGESKIVEEVTVEQFVKSGGKVLAIGRLIV